MKNEPRPAGSGAFSDECNRPLPAGRGSYYWGQFVLFAGRFGFCDFHDERLAEQTARTVRLFDGIPAHETPATAPIVQAAERLTGHPAEAVAFGTEAPYFDRLGMQTLVLGPGDIDQAHQPDEYLALERIRPYVELLRSLIGRFCIDPEQTHAQP